MIEDAILGQLAAAFASAQTAFGFAGRLCCGTFGAAMRKPVLLLSALLASIGFVRGELKTPENVPIEITSTGETTYENGLATARDNVAIHVGDTDIYADYAQYNSTTHEVELRGHVRIYRDKPTATVVPNKPAHKYNEEESDQQISFYRADSGIYNIDTKRIRATNMRTESQPYFLSGQNVSEISEKAYLIQNGTFTTHDAPNPDFHLQARTIRVYEKDRVIFRNVTLYVGKVPVFWWPYLYQSLNDAFSFTVTPAYLSSWGPSVLTQVTFPITDNIKGRIRLDYRGRRGVAVGFDPTIEYGKDNNSWAKIKTYYIQDQNPDINDTAVPRTGVPTGRYRLSLQDRTNLAEDIYGIADLRLQFPQGSGFENYGSTRLDTFHQFLYPNTYFGWLSIVPRVGFRGTYYGETRDLGNTIFTSNPNPLVPDFLLPNPTLANPIDFGGDTFRTVFDPGVDASFKVSRTWENVQSRAFGLDGLLHVIQPFTNFSYVSENG